MQLGLNIPHTGQLADPAFVREFCQTAEQLGYGALWVIDHVVMPERIASEYTLGRRPARQPDNSVSELMSPNYESTSTLLWVAGFTSRIKLGTSVSVLPLRNPVLNARMLATLDIYSGGRLLYGVGVGWLREEAEAMQVPWDHRGARSDEHIALLRRIWLADGPLVDFKGRFYEFANMDPEPRPIQKPPPILIGGHTDAALNRAARIGDGWIASMMSAPRFAEHLTRLRDATRAGGRDPEALLLVNSMRVSAGTTESNPLGEPVDQVIERVVGLRAVGVDHLALIIPAPSHTVLLAAIRLIVSDVLPALV